MKLRLLQIGKTSERYLEEGIADYEKRIRPFCSFQIETLPSVKDAARCSADVLKLKEAEMVLSRLKPDDLLILLDERGKTFSSREFAGFVEKQFHSGSKNLCFLIGGAFGFADALYDRARFKVSLSEMTFSHQLIRLVFMEQLYRAMTILHNHPYHND